jgi:hypothetical protein
VAESLDLSSVNKYHDEHLINDSNNYDSNIDKFNRS